METFHDWKLAVRDTQRKLRELDYYLNDLGLQRLRIFSLLADMAAFCDDARELLAWIDSKEELDPEEIADLASGQAAPPIRRLRLIAEQEGQVK